MTITSALIWFTCDDESVLSVPWVKDGKILVLIELYIVMQKILWKYPVFLEKLEITSLLLKEFSYHLKSSLIFSIKF